LNVVPFPMGEDPGGAAADAKAVAAEGGGAPPKTDAAPKTGAPYKVSTGQFKVAGGLFEVVSPEAAFRNVVLFERDPLVRVAAKRAFAKRGVKILQFGTLEDTRAAMTDLFRSNS